MSKSACLSSLSTTEQSPVSSVRVVECKDAYHGRWTLKAGRRQRRKGSRGKREEAPKPKDKRQRAKEGRGGKGKKPGAP
jgi:hypothetical protein